MKEDLIRKHLPASPAMSKGHMKRPRARIRSKRKKDKMARQRDKKVKVAKVCPNAVRTNTHLVRTMSR